MKGSKTLKISSDNALTVFDLDHTLLKVNASFEFGRFLYGKNSFSTLNMFYLVACYVQHKIFGMSLEKLHNKIFNKLFCGKFLASFTDLVELFLNEKLDGMTNRAVLNELEEAKKRGEKIVLLSNSPHFLVEPIAKRFGILIYAGTEYCLDAYMKFSQMGTLMEGKQKAKYVLNLAKEWGVSQKQITVFSDSLLDLPLLEIAGKVVAVNPDATLLHMCRRENWQIM